MSWHFSRLPIYRHFSTETNYPPNPEDYANNSTNDITIDGLTAQQAKDDKFVRVYSLSQEKESEDLLHWRQKEPYPDIVEQQYKLVLEKPNNLFLKYDLVIRLLMHLRPPFSEDSRSVNDIFRAIYRIVKELADSNRFKSILQEKVSQQFSSQDIQHFKAKIVEYKSKVGQQSDNSFVTASLIHYILLTGDVDSALSYAEYGHRESSANYYCDSALSLEKKLIHAGIGQGDPVLQMLEKGLEYMPNHSKCLSRMACIHYYNKKHFRNALKYAKMAIEADVANRNAEAHYIYALLHDMEFYNPEIAKKHYSKALEIAPGNVPSLCNLGAVLYQEKRYDEAIKYLKLASHHKSNDTISLYHLANCYSAKGLLEAAVIEMDKCFKITPNLPDGHYHLANILFRHHDFEGAIEGYKKSIELAAQTRSFFDINMPLNNLIAVNKIYAQSLIVNAKGPEDYAKAAHHLQEVLDLSPDENRLYKATMYLNIVYCFMKSGNVDESLMYIQMAREDGGEEFLNEYKDLKVRFTSENVYQQRQKHADDLLLFETYLQKYEEKCKEEGSQPDTEEMTKVFKDIARCHYNLAFCAYHIGKIEDVERHLVSVVTKTAPPYVSDYIEVNSDMDEEYDPSKPIIVDNVNMYGTKLPQSPVLRDVLCKKLYELKDKYKDKTLDAIIDPPDLPLNPSAVRKAKGKKKKRLRYIVEAEKRNIALRNHISTANPYDL